MGFYELLLIPILFGLVGFFEPCSLGINLIFLNRIQKFDRVKRVSESLVFSVVRGFFLAVVGLGAAFIGSKFITIQSSLFIILGTVYILLGTLMIINKYKPIFKVDINFGRYFQRRGAVALGVVFGLIIPACAIGFVIALIGQALIVGDLLGGFISLFVFGVTLSLPLVIISYSEKSTQAMQRIAHTTNKIPWLAGAILIAVGVLTILSSVWWAGALA